jgi:hypothetical protein
VLHRGTHTVMTRAKVGCLSMPVVAVLQPHKNGIQGLGQQPVAADLLESVTLLDTC